jgi:hypothetical protein
MAKIIMLLDNQALCFEQSRPRGRVMFESAESYDSDGMSIIVERKHIYQAKVTFEDQSSIVQLGVPYRITKRGFARVGTDDYKVYSAVPAAYVTDLRDLLGDIAQNRELPIGAVDFVNSYGRLPRRRR